jgi:hypothetical protein
MSAVPTTPSVPAPRSGRLSAIVRWVTGGVLAAAAIAAIAIAVWPASEADKARDDGKQFGEAVAALYTAESPAEVDAALVDIRDAAVDTRDHAGDRVAEQVDQQAAALDRAADGFVGAHTTDDEWSADLYQAELDTAVDDLASQADEFRTEGTEVQQAFWDGYETGVNGNAHATTTSSLD